MMSKMHLSPNPARSDRSPSPGRKSPQIFEPPPLGCRPEIKIPPNPMAALRKVQTPKAKDDFWKDEYIRERSKSPLPGTEAAPAVQQSPSQTNQPIANDNSRYNPPQFGAPQQNSAPAPLRNTFNRQPSLKNDFEQPHPQPSTPVRTTFNRQPSLKNDFAAQPSPAPAQPRNPFNRQPSWKNEFEANNNTSNAYNSPRTTAPPVQPPWLQPKPEENVPTYVRSAQRARSPAPAQAQPQARPNQESYPVYQRSGQRNVAAQPPVNSYEPPKPVQQQDSTPFYARPARNVAQAPNQQPRYELPAASRAAPSRTVDAFIREPGNTFRAAPQAPSKPNNQSVSRAILLFK